MLLEEALANNNNNNTTNSSSDSGGGGGTLLSPHDTALALLSFLRDELPAGGTAAEKRFVNLFVPICNRVFGEWNNAAIGGVDGLGGGVGVGGELGSPRGSTPNSTPSRSPNSVTTSPGGSTYSSPTASPGGDVGRESDYRHGDGGWMSLYSSPISQQQQQQQRSGSGVGVGGGIAQRSPQSSRTSMMSLEHDPIVRLLRAPRKQPRSNDNTTTSYSPTLMDAISAESIHRPSIRFKFPLKALATTGMVSTVDDWQTVFWNEIEKERDVASAVVGTAGRGGFGMSGAAGLHTAAVPNAAINNEVARPAAGVVGKENATRILLHLLSGKPKDQLELKAHFVQSFQNQHHVQGQQHQHGFGTFGSPSPLKSRLSTPGSTLGYNSTPMRGTNFTTSTPGRGNVAATAIGTQPNLELTMLEYYLFLFLRFPLSNTLWEVQLQDQQRQRRTMMMHHGTNRSSVYTPYGQRVYAHLFTSYLNYYLEQGRVYEEGRLGVGSGCFDGVCVNADDGGSAVASGNNNMMNSMGSVAGSNGTLERTSELFLRLIIEFWMEGSNVAPTTAASVARYQRVRAGVTTTTSPSQEALRPSLRDSLELSQPMPPPTNTTTGVAGSPLASAASHYFTWPPSQVQFHIMTLVRHLVSDNSMRELVKRASGRMQQRQKEDREGSAVASSTGRGTPTLVNDGDGAQSGSATPTSGLNTNSNINNNSSNANMPWPLPPAMTATQPSLFNYIRLGLACGAIHDRSSIFHRSLETWLVWLEPWNYVMKRRVLSGALHRSSSSGSMGGSGVSGGGMGGGGTRRAGEFLRNAAATVSSHRMEYYPAYVAPKPTSPSTYNPQWEAYIVANAHYYTVPLAIFLKRARELDFSSTVEYPRSLALVQRVLRIYSKAVVNVLNSVLNCRADALSTTLFTKHGTNMGPYRPPSNWKLVECQVDATNLLEEIYSQYQKRKAAMDVFDRLEAKMNAFFDGTVISGDEKALDNLLGQVRYLVNLPLDYQVLPEEMRVVGSLDGLWRLLGLRSSKDSAAGLRGEDSMDSSHFPDRGPDGKLTDLGRQQLHAGLCKCNPLDIHYIGDPMLARVKSYEIPALVEFTIFASNYLNEKLGLVPTPLSEEEDVVIDEDDRLLRQYREMEQYQKVKFRVNLRFLADSRNIIFVAIVWWVYGTIRGFFKG